MISTAIEDYLNVSFSAIGNAEKLRKNVIREDGTCSQALESRCFFLAQTVASIVALPLNLLALVFAPALALCTEGKEKAWKILGDLSWITAVHLSLIPSSLIAAFTPHSWEYLSPTNELLDCQKEMRENAQ